MHKFNLVTIEQREFFQDHGFVLIPLKLSTNEIDSALDGLKAMKKKAIEQKFKLSRTYYDHILKWNIAAIEAPFNQVILDQRVKKILSKIKIGTLASSLMRWDKAFCPLARLFTMGNYNYRGTWHRDDNITQIDNPDICNNVVQAEIYFEKQEGFRILKKKYDIGGSNSIIADHNEDKVIHSYPFPLMPPKDSFYTMCGEPGSILFFNPLRLHQGNCKGDRHDFHMRFQDFNTAKLNKIFSSYSRVYDFFCVNELDENADIGIIEEKNILPNGYRQKIFKRLMNSFNYRIPVFNYLKVIKNNKTLKKISPSWRPDYLSNSAFQKN